VNAFVSGGYLPATMRGKKLEGYVTIADWYSTFCGLAGVDPTDEKAKKANLPPVDSINMWEYLSGKTTTPPRDEVPIGHVTDINHGATRLNGLIMGDYKCKMRNGKYLPSHPFFCSACW